MNSINKNNAYSSCEQESVLIGLEASERWIKKLGACVHINKHNGEIYMYRVVDSDLVIDEQTSGYIPITSKVAKLKGCTIPVFQVVTYCYLISDGIIYHKTTLN